LPSPRLDVPTLDGDRRARSWRPAGGRPASDPARQRRRCLWIRRLAMTERTGRRGPLHARESHRARGSRKDRNMARLKHSALSTAGPAATANFYKSVFGLTELRREPPDSGAEGVWLSDGYIYLAVLKHESESAPNLGVGASTVKGVHHIGFQVD